MLSKPFATICVAASMLCAVTTANAEPFLVTLDTSPLSGTQTLIFGLANFDPASNSVLLSDFAFDGGSVVEGTDACIGLGCTGDLTGLVNLEDSDPISVLFTQQFSPGGSLSFVLDPTNNFSGGSTPDQFSMFVCDDTVSACYSDDAFGAMLLLDLTGDPLTPSSFVLSAARQHPTRWSGRAHPARPVPRRERNRIEAGRKS